VFAAAVQRLNRSTAPPRSEYAEFRIRGSLGVNARHAITSARTFFEDPSHCGFTNIVKDIGIKEVSKSGDDEATS
jgi:hypothetical protein